jgi:hypothetical protein
VSQDLEKIAHELAPDVAQRMLAAAHASRTEADFRREAALILEDVASKAGVVLTAREEYHVACGRVDSVYNRLVIEYERPGTLGERNAPPITLTAAKATVITASSQNTSIKTSNAVSGPSGFMVSSPTNRQRGSHGLGASVQRVQRTGVVSEPDVGIVMIRSSFNHQMT